MMASPGCKSLSIKKLELFDSEQQKAAKIRNKSIPGRKTRN